MTAPFQQDRYAIGTPERVAAQKATNRAIRDALGRLPTPPLAAKE